jgi:hypothetical protein
MFSFKEKLQNFDFMNLAEANLYKIKYEANYRYYICFNNAADFQFQRNNIDNLDWWELSFLILITGSIIRFLSFMIFQWTYSENSSKYSAYVLIL